MKELAKRTWIILLSNKWYIGIIIFCIICLIGIVIKKRLNK